MMFFQVNNNNNNINYNNNSTSLLSHLFVTDNTSLPSSSTCSDNITNITTTTTTFTLFSFDNVVLSKETSFLNSVKLEKIDTNEEKVASRQLVKKYLFYLVLFNFFY
jgi:hypothetical protein